MERVVNLQPVHLRRDSECVRNSIAKKQIIWLQNGQHIYTDVSQEKMCAQPVDIQEKMLPITGHCQNANPIIPLQRCEKDRTYQVLVRTWRKGDHLHHWQQCKLVFPLWKIAWRFLKIKKRKLLDNPAILPLNVQPKEKKLVYLRDI